MTERREKFKTAFWGLCEVAEIKPCLILNKQRVRDLCSEYEATGDEDVFDELYNCVWREKELLRLKIKRLARVLKKPSGGFQNNKKYSSRT